jgi:nicotinamide-nucleotide amidase
MTMTNAADGVDTSCITEALAQALMQRQWQLATAESCTGGLIAATCTDLAGSSAWFERGVVTYSNQAKTELLGVPFELIDREGAVSEPVVRAMAEGLLKRSPADITVAVTGVAGPSGGSALKPVGTVWMAWAVRGQPTLSECRCWLGDRAAVRHQTTAHVLSTALQIILTPDVPRA